MLIEANGKINSILQLVTDFNETMKSVREEPKHRKLDWNE